MRFSEFKYQKQATPEKRRVIVLTEDADHLAGIDVDKLDKAEQEEIQKAFDAFQVIVSRVMNKAFRNFKKSRIVD